jgi:hypothetical protein
MTTTVIYNVPETFSGTADVTDLVRQPKPAVEGAASATDWTRREAPSAALNWRSISPDTGRQQVPVVAIKPDERELNIVISRISQLLQEEDDFRPTEYALRTTLALVYEANQILRGSFARAAAAVDEDGSIVIYWKRPERNIHLTIPSQEDGPLYIYHREGGEYGTERPVSAASLASWLQWFMRV